MHVRYKSLYISLPSSAKQQREMPANFSYFHLKLNAVVAYLASARF